MTLAQIDSEIERTRNLLESAKTYKRTYDEWAKRKTAAESVGAPPHDEAKLAKLRIALEDQRIEWAKASGASNLYKSLQDAISKSDMTAVTGCPLCGSAITDPVALKKRLIDQILQHETLAKQLSLVVTKNQTEITNGTWAMTQWHSQKSILDHQFEEAAHQLELAVKVEADIPQLEINIKGMMSVRTDIEGIVRGCAQVETRRELNLQKRQQYSTELTAGLNLLEQTKHYKTGQPIENVATAIQTELQRVDMALTSLQQQKIRLAGLQGQLAETDRHLAELGVTLQDLEKRRDQQGTYRETVATLGRVRDWFHYANGPHALAVSVMNELTTDVNQFLIKLNAPFMVTMDDNSLAYRCAFTDGRAMPSSGFPDASDLSGGQKILLAIAFRLASYCMFASRQGLISLDEPTTYLDKENVGNICVLFEKIKDIAKSMGLQIITATHEPSLMSVCDTVIDLNKEKL